MKVAQSDQMHSPGYRVTLILKKYSQRRNSGYHPDGERKSPCKFQLPLRGGAEREQAACDIKPFPI